MTDLWIMLVCGSFLGFVAGQKLAAVVMKTKLELWLSVLAKENPKAFDAFIATAKRTSR